MNRTKTFLVAMLAGILAVGAIAAQRDTNTTTTTTAYTPKAPGDVLVGQESGVEAFWIAGIGGTTNDWRRLGTGGATTNFTILRSTGVTGTVNLVGGVVTNKP